jgi:peptide/nickel transport system substrate-binding protein
MKRSTFLKSLFAFGFSTIIGSTGAIAGESPDLAAMVKAGTLPPLNERLPEIPLMLPVVDEIGQYGGTLRRAFLGPGDHNNYTRAVYDALIRYAPDGSQLSPTLLLVGNPTRTSPNGLFA